MSPASSDINRVRAIYDQFAPTWNQRQGFVERVLMGDAMRKELARHLRGDVLELGSGTGATFPFLDWDVVTSLTATDLSGGMLDQARQREAIVNGPITFRQLDASVLPFDDETFDSVTTSLMLCTVPDPEETLREMSRVARPGGRIVVLEHVRAHNRLLAGTQRLLSPLQHRQMGCHLDRATDELVRDLGFTIVDHQTRFFGVFQLLVLEPLPARDAVSSRLRP